MVSMTDVSDKIENIKNFIEFQLEFLGISFETFFEQDDSLGGYCYLICSDHAAVIFSDNTEDNSLKMFKLNDKMLTWADGEGLTEEQRETMSAYIPVNRVCDMLDHLSDSQFTKSA